MDLGFGKRVFFLGKRVDVLTADVTNPENPPRLYMAAFTGRVRYPEWFILKYPYLGLHPQGALPYAA
jgi:hypothetical protein